jgi:hypothetical protein
MLTHPLILQMWGGTTEQAARIKTAKGLREVLYTYILHHQCGLLDVVLQCSPSEALHDLGGVGVEGGSCQRLSQCICHIHSSRYEVERNEVSI